MTSPITPAGGNWQNEANRLRQAGYAMPNNPVMARLEARKVADSIGRGSLTDLMNRQRTAEMNRSRLASTRGSTGSLIRTASDVQMALPKIRQPLSSLSDKGVPFNVNDPKELIELRRWCNTPQAPVWMGDYSFKPMGEIEVGDEVIGWETYDNVWGSGRRELTKTTVLAINRRIAPEVVRITFASGRTVECTPDHEWLRYYAPGADGRILNGPEKSLTARHTSDYAPLRVGSIARSVIVPTEPLADIEKIKAASWLAGIIDGEGSVSKRTVRIVQSPKRNPDICARIDATLDLLGITHRRREVKRNDAARGTGVHGGDMIVWDFQRGGQQTSAARKNRQQIVDLLNWAKPTKFDAEWLDGSLLSKNFGEPDEVVSIESLGPGEVVSMQTGTGNYTAWGYASKNCRLYYATHDLVPLLVDIYSKFPVTGMEFVCKDPLIEKFYTQMFLDDLNYEEFLPDAIGREYFVAGEVTTLAHFNEQLGIWSSEEVLNPDMIAVSKSLFVEEERVQLLVKDLVESLRQGPNGSVDSKERPSERLERNFEYQQLVKYYPEILQAAARDDGLDISDALVSRLVNRANPWDLRGTPPLLRSMRTLLMEEELNAAQDAVASRLYAPMILATMGIDNMGNDEPWIPSQGELDDLRDDMQNALAADFKLLVHNFGVKVESVFGRESVPDFSNDYDRIDAKLMQAWGIGSALIMGGTGAGGAYASSALNREVCEQLMVGFQKKVVRHIRKRMEIIAEAQEHYDYELKGGLRVPLYREIVEEDPETGEQRIVRVPKLLIPEVHFSCVVPGTQVLTPTGQRNVEDVQPGDEVVAWDDDNGYVIDTALHTGVEHRDALVEVTTATGRSIRCTADHPFWTNQGWVQAQDLTDQIALRTSAGQLGAQIESEDDLDLLRFLGLLVGDGNYSTTHVQLSVSDPAVDEFVCEIAKRLGLTARKKIDARTDKVWYRTFVRPSPWKGNALRNPLHTLLRDQGMWGKNGHTKRVPPLVWSAGAKGRAAFLSGYFDADGYASRISGLKITSVNRALLDDCQVLFESLGIRAQVGSYKYHYEGQKNPGLQSVNILTISHNHYYRLARAALSPMIPAKSAALDVMAQPPLRNTRPHFQPVEWDQVVAVRPIGGGDIVTLGIAQTHTHVTAGLVSHNTLNLRDETQERMFITQLKQMGVPISDKALAVNIQVDFEQELEREAQETVDKGMAKAQAFKKMQDLCDLEGLPYPPELVMHLQATLQLRQMLSQTTMAEDQAKMMDDQTKAASAAGQLGAMPGTQPMPGAPGADMMGGGGPPQDGGPQSTPPEASGPSSPPPDQGGGGDVATAEPPRNRQRPAESDEQRANAPRAASARWAKRIHKAKNGEPVDDRPPTKFELGPSSVGRSRYASEDSVAAAIQRREMYARHRGTPLVSQLVNDPAFFRMCHATGDMSVIKADWPEIRAGGAKESEQLLRDLVDQYEEITGVAPIWDA